MKGWARMLAVLLLAWGPSLGWAAIGEVLRVRGEAWLWRQELRAPATAKQALEPGDRLETGAEARVDLRLDDGSLITLAADTSFRLEDYRHEPEGEAPGLGLFELSKGGFRAVTGALTQRPGHRVEVRTPVATIGVRGTEFTGELSEDGLDVAMLEGTGVWVRGLDGQQVELDRPGWRTRVVWRRDVLGERQALPPEPPRELERQEWQRLRQRLDWNGLERLRPRVWRKLRHLRR